ncbi:MAG: acetolactate synthase large subunit [Mycobacteriaceae bacterium]|nr:acetolactate synthase large subunit [Mycobacteriaceae bacterium]
MNGAQALLATLVEAGVQVCFANPGTSEMHFVAALDTVPRMRGVLTLFEGVATGAADGYARMSDHPAAVLLHLGPGLGNGLANLHNARRARVPMLVVVGDHATYHKRYDAPLESDIESVAGTVSGWLRCCSNPADIAGDAVEAIASARAHRHIATLILPADVSWMQGAEPARHVVTDPSAPVAHLDAAVAALQSGEPTAILVGGDATRAKGLEAAARVAQAHGATLLCETFPTRLQRGAGLPPIERLAYLAEAATAQLAGLRHLILAGAASPVSFFAYPGKASDLVPEGCAVHTLSGPVGAADALGALADRVAPDVVAPAAPLARPALPSGPLDVATSAADWLTLTGGAIGYGLPAAAGAAIAALDRPVLCLESDGSAMYTISALWTHAHEGLDITTVVYANRAYDILRIELQRVGAQADAQATGPAAEAMLDLSAPALDFVALAEGMGVPARRVATAEDFADALRWAFGEPGPHLIEAVMPSIGG